MKKTSKKAVMVIPQDLTPEQERAAKEMSPGAALEDSGIAFDPTTQHLDLSKEEKRRTTALMMAIQAYQNLIIKDADYLREATSNAKRGDGPVIEAATMNAMVEAAVQFDFFIETGGSVTTEEIRRGMKRITLDGPPSPEAHKEESEV